MSSGFSSSTSDDDAHSSSSGEYYIEDSPRQSVKGTESDVFPYETVSPKRNQNLRKFRSKRHMTQPLETRPQKSARLDAKSALEPQFEAITENQAKPSTSTGYMRRAKNEKGTFFDTGPEGIQLKIEDKGPLKSEAEAPISVQPMDIGIEVSSEEMNDLSEPLSSSTPIHSPMTEGSPNYIPDFSNRDAVFQYMPLRSETDNLPENISRPRFWYVGNSFDEGFNPIVWSSSDEDEGPQNKKPHDTSGKDADNF